MESSQSEEKPSDPEREYSCKDQIKLMGISKVKQSSYSPWWSTSCSLPQGRQGSGMSRIPGHLLPPFSWADNAGRSSLVWPHLLSVEVRRKNMEVRFNSIHNSQRPYGISTRARKAHQIVMQESELKDHFWFLGRWALYSVRLVYHGFCLRVTAFYCSLHRQWNF